MQNPLVYKQLELPGHQAMEGSQTKKEQIDEEGEKMDKGIGGEQEGILQGNGQKDNLEFRKTIKYGGGLKYDDQQFDKSFWKMKQFKQESMKIEEQELVPDQNQSQIHDLDINHCNILTRPNPLDSHHSLMIKEIFHPSQSPSSVFDPTSLTLTLLCQVRNQIQLRTKKKLFYSYFSLHQQFKQQNSTLRSEFTKPLKQIPLQRPGIIYFTVKQAATKRYNILVRFASGQLVAYFETILQIKIFKKVKKIIEYFASHCLSVILDTTQSSKLPQNIASFKKCLPLIYCLTVPSEQFVLDTCRSLQTQLLRSKQSTFYHFVNSKSLFILPKQLPEQMAIRDAPRMISTLNSFEDADEAFLGQLRTIAQESDRHLNLEFIAVNIKRIYSCQTIQVFQIFQNLFMMRQKEVGNYERRAKERESTLNQNDQNSHFPQKATSSSYCQRCKIITGRKLKKSIQRCEACSKIKNKSINLCKGCFEDFHNNLDYFLSRIKNKKTKADEPQELPDEKKEEKSFEKESIEERMADEIIEIKQKMDHYQALLLQIIDDGKLDDAQILVIKNLQQCMLRMNKIMSEFPHIEPGISGYGVQAVRHANAAQYCQDIANNNPLYDPFFYLRQSNFANAFHQGSSDMRRNSQTVKHENLKVQECAKQEMRPNIVEGAEFEEIIREYSERNEMEIENAEFEEEDDNYFWSESSSEGGGQDEDDFEEEEHQN